MSDETARQREQGSQPPCIRRRAAAAGAVCVLVATVCIASLSASRSVERVELEGKGTQSTMSSIENQLQGAQQMFDDAQVYTCMHVHMYLCF